MASRYSRRRKIRNDLEEYQSFFKSRGINSAVIYETPTIYHPTDHQLGDINMEPYRWTVGSRFWKLAEDFYGDPSYWWVIAWFNQTPTEGHLEAGDLIHVPLPLEEILGILGV